MTYRYWILGCVLACAGAWATACSSVEVCDNNVDDDGNGLIDCADPVCALDCQKPDAGLDGATDGATPDQAVADAVVDTPPSADQFVPSDLGVGTALQSVLNTLDLPNNGQDYARVYNPGEQPKNKLGSTLATIGLFLDLQAQVDDGLASGNILLLLNLFADDLINATPARIQAFVGDDTDGNAANNFSGNAVLAISASSPPNAAVDGAITNGAFSGEGTIIVPLPLGTGVNVTLQRAMVTGGVSAAGVTSGVITGAIPSSEINGILLPAIAQFIVDGWANFPSKDLIALVLGVPNPPTVNDITNSQLIKGFFEADVDTNGDQTPDAMSLGMGFTAVSCTFALP